MDLPLIKDLGDGWFLVAHPNGAAIATAHTLSVLYTECAEMQSDEHLLFSDEEERDSTAPPEEMRARAVKEFEDFAWRRVRSEFWVEDDA